MLSWQGDTGCSHLMLHRDTGDRIVTGIVVLGKREVPRGTLKNLLEQLKISPEDLRDALR